MAPGERNSDKSFNDDDIFYVYQIFVASKVEVREHSLEEPHQELWTKMLNAANAHYKKRQVSNRTNDELVNIKMLALLCAKLAIPIPFHNRFDSI